MHECTLGNPLISFHPRFPILISIINAFDNFVIMYFPNTPTQKFHNGKKCESSQASRIASQ